MSAFFATPTAARDTLLNLSIQEALQEGEQKSVIQKDVKLFFAGQPHPEVAKSFGEFRTNKKTNAFNKSDKEACHWNFFSAIKSLQERALKEGGDAVIDIKSNYRDKEFVSATEFQCGAGAIMAGVAFKGTVVKLK
ncbi:MAG: hypothetical protein FJ147_01980 [Deltaproteobacteria bacterium]|nr:hypothetical protein [Deltaproteobacteria bacterium]